MLFYYEAYFVRQINSKVNYTIKQLYNYTINSKVNYTIEVYFVGT